MKSLTLANLATVLDARSCKQWELDSYILRRQRGPPLDQQPPNCTPSSGISTDASIQQHKPFLVRTDTTQTFHAENKVQQLPIEKSKPHMVHLSVVQSYEHWCKHPCMGVTWETAAPKPKVKDSGPYLLYEAAIWQQEDPPRLALYAFDSDFETKARNSWKMCDGKWECFNFLILRENHNLLNVKLDKEKLSKSLKKGFAQIFEFISQRSDGGIKVMTYSGHGSDADGSWFEGSLDARDARSLLRQSQKHIEWDIMNFATNCLEGKWNMLWALYPYTKYIVASDLEVGGWEEKGPLSDRDGQVLVKALQDTSELAMLKKGAEEKQEIGIILKGMLDGRENLWWRLKNTRKNKHRQSVSVFKSDQVAPFHDTMLATFEKQFPKGFKPLQSSDGPRKHFVEEIGNPAKTAQQYFDIIGQKDCDVYEAAELLNNLNNNILEKFKTMRHMYITTNSIFRWKNDGTNKPVSNGLKFNYVSSYDGKPPCQLGEFFKDYRRKNAEQDYYEHGTPLY